MYFILFGSSSIIREYSVVFLGVVGVIASGGDEGWRYSELKYVSYEKKNGVQKAPHKVSGSSFVRHAISIEHIHIGNIYLYIIYTTTSWGYYNRVLGVDMC